MKRYWYGVSIKDLAQQMQISESSAKVRLHRIRGRLKKISGKLRALGYDRKGFVRQLALCG